jgi:broad specificity phosphatase PhoE
MSVVFFISHPEVIVDATVPVPRWHLSDRGIHRMRTFAASSDLQNLAAVWASHETKAIEAAGLLAAAFGLPVGVHGGLHKNDRTATGFLPPPEFERTADAFFALPEESVRGWERAKNAQVRVAAAVEAVLNRSPDGPTAIVSHGGVGTLLLRHYSNIPISRDADQPFQGHYWAFERSTRNVLHPWRPVAPR